MDRKTFLIRRDNIQMRMEARRMTLTAQTATTKSENKLKATLPIAFAILKHFLFKNKVTLVNTVVTAAGLGMFSSIIPKGLSKLIQTIAEKKKHSIFS